VRAGAIQIGKKQNIEEKEEGRKRDPPLEYEFEEIRHKWGIKGHRRGPGKQHGLEGRKMREDA